MSDAVQRRVETSGGLECRIVDAAGERERPSLVVVLCHGFGAPGTDLVPLADELLARRPGLVGRVRFVFPAAPLALDAPYGGRAWWPLDVERITAAIERGELRNLRNDVPPGLREARERLTALVKELADGDGVETGQVVLGGFSQGAMLATDVALRLPECPAGLCIFSGTLLCESEWRPLAKKRGPLPVLQTHGRQDPLLPFEAARWLCDMLQEAGLPVEFVPFDGPHTISASGVDRAAEMLGRLTAG